MNIFEFRDQLIDDDASYINSFIQIRDPTFTTTFSRNCTKRLEPPPADPAVAHEPREVEAERQRLEPSPSTTPRPKREGRLVEGARDFIAGIDAAPETAKTLLQRLCKWAGTLEQAQLVKLWTFHGKGGILTLLPRLQADNAGLVSIWNNNGTAYLQFWRSVFERRAPSSLARIEQSIMPIKQGNTTREVSQELLDALTDAYREAVSGEIAI